MYGPPADKRDITTKSEKSESDAYFKTSIHVEPFLKISMIYRQR